MPLTDVAVRNFKPVDKVVKLSDGGGLFLLVDSKGSKYWRLAYRIAGKQKTLAIGVYPQVSLADAREKREQAKKMLKNGVDPMLARKEEKLLRHIQSANTFESVAREWLEHQAGRITAHTATRILASLERYVFPALGNLPVTSIQPPMVLDVIRGVERQGILDTASRILQRVNAVFRYAIQTGRVAYNPAADMKGALKARVVQNHPALTIQELPEFLRRLESFEGFLQTKLAMKFILLTFVRTGELRGARWSEFDFDKKEWKIPADRMKMRSPHIVPLSHQAISILEELLPVTGESEFLFPNRNDYEKTISENTLLYAIGRMGYYKKATVHGFRATASTILNEAGFNPDAIERQLAHKEKNRVRAAYHRSEYMDERRTMMQWWADRIDQLGTKKIS